MEHLEYQDRVSSKPLAPFCFLLTLKQVRTSQNQFLYNRLKMGTVGARATGARRAHEGLSEDVSGYLDPKQYSSECSQNRDFIISNDSSNRHY